MEKKLCTSEEFVIGIDLGTTYSCVAVWIDDRIETLPDDNGKKTIASCVAFHGNELLVGNIAKDLYYKDPTNTLFDAKRLIGGKYSDPIVQNNVLSWPFKVTEGEGSKPMLTVKYKGEEKSFRPEEISSMVLMRLRKIAEDYVKCSVKKAVIAVPAYFNDAQRQATKDAAVLAGLDVMHMISEPSAVAVAYSHKKGLWSGRKNVLVFDLGGGTLDVTLLTILEGRFEVKSTVGDLYLGGEDFVKRLVDHFITEIKKKLNRDISGDPEAGSELRRVCEKVKRKLSFTTSYPFRLQAGHDINFTTTVERSLFEEINKDLFRKCLNYVKDCLRDGGMRKDEVNEVVLAGGSTRIPKIQELLVGFFGSRELICMNSKQEQMVAHGAAIYAGVLSGRNVKFFRSLSDTNPLSIGLETDDGEMTVLIPRNTKIPTMKSFDLDLNEEGKANSGGGFCSCKIRVYAKGKNREAAENNLLGEFNLSNIPNDSSKIEVCLDITVDGILAVSAMEKSSGQKNEIRISNDQRRVSKEELEKMFLEAERFKLEAEKHKKLEKVLNDYSYNINEALRRDWMMMDHNNKFDPKDELKIKESIQQVQEWLQSNKLNVDEQEFERKITWLQNICLPIVKKLLHQHPIEENNSSIKIKSHRHSLSLDRAMSFHNCNSCQELLLKSQPCYSCKKKRCNFHIHKQCALAEASPFATHPFLRDCEEFQFEEHEATTDIQLLLCEACGKTVKGSFYRCRHHHQPAHVLHPCCLKLDQTIINDDMMLHLTNRVMSECKKCYKKQLREGFNGWSYTTTDGRCCYHVACVMDMINKINEIEEEEEEEDEGVGRSEKTSEGEGRFGKSKKSYRKREICFFALQVARVIILQMSEGDSEIPKILDSALDIFQRFTDFFGK